MKTDQTVKKSSIIFSNMPILCPWITSQPYQSAVRNKNKLVELEKKNKNHNNQDVQTQQSKNESELPTPSSYGFPIQESSSNFFYFLRLMQLFPETHPATIHTVLTLTKNNFFHAIDKLLYAKQCKTAFGKRAPHKMRTNHKNVGSNPPRKAQESREESGKGNNQSFEKLQQTIVLDGNPYELEPISKEKPSDLSTQVFEICVDEKGQSKQFNLTKLNNQEVIEIVCFENGYDQKNQVLQKNVVLENAIEANNNQQMVVLSEAEEQSLYQDEKGGMFLEDSQNVTSDEQNFDDKMYLETDVDSDLIKIHSIGEASSKMEFCDNF